jgi:feruloyl esterase
MPERRFLVSVATLLVLSVFALGSSHTLPATACVDLTSLRIPDTAIASAAVVAGGPAGGGLAQATLPAHCKVAAVATPTPDSHINIEIWIPVDNWNGRLLGTANGGFSGSIPVAAMATAVARGYAAVGTDTGHAGDQLEFGDGHPEKIVDWAYRSVHVMTGLAKLVIRDHRGRFPDRSYFNGCSTGGQQGLSEAQRFPDDYDGIVAGDPGHNRVRLILGFLWSWMAAHPDGSRSILTPASLSLATRAAVDSCDADDGLKDGLIADPRRCRFDPSTLICRGTPSDACLTPEQAAAIKKIYDGARNARTGEQIFPGWARGSEQGWGGYITNPAEPVRFQFFTSFLFHDPKWDMHSFDWDRDVAYAEAQLPYLAATSRDLDAFKRRGGKLIMYTGTADPVAPPADAFSYYEDVARRAGGYETASQLFRFFPVPGMGHCNGGPGPSVFDALGALEQWVEAGRAPDTILASHVTAGKVDRTRPLCPYPRVAKYKGTGSVDDAANFSCVAPLAPDRGR